MCVHLHDVVVDGDVVRKYARPTRMGMGGGACDPAGTENEIALSRGKRRFMTNLFWRVYPDQNQYGSVPEDSESSSGRIPACRSKSGHCLEEWEKYIDRFGHRGG